MIFYSIYHPTSLIISNVHFKEDSKIGPGFIMILNIKAGLNKVVSNTMAVKYTLY